METSEWPPSNYPIFFALILLTATAVTLAMGNETRAEELAIYAYYLLVIGITIRFFETSLPDNTPEKIGYVKSRILKTTGHLKIWTNQHTSNTVSTIVCNTPSLGKLINRTKSKIRLKITKHQLICLHEISKDVSLYLVVLFLLLSAYGYVFGWWIINGYMENLAQILIGFFAAYLLLSIILKKPNKD